MRDVNIQNATMAGEVRRRQRSNQKWKTFAASPAASNVVYEFREESKPTVRVGGKYVRPTHYFATSARKTVDTVFAEYHSTAAAPTFDQLVLDCHTGNGGDAPPIRLKDAHLTGLNAVSKRPIFPSNLMSAVRSRVSDGVADSDINVGVALGELRESLETVGSLLRDAKSLLKGIRKLGRAMPKDVPLHTVEVIVKRRKSSSRVRRHTSSHTLSRKGRWYKRNQEIYQKFKWGNPLESGPERVVQRFAREYLRYMYGIRPLMSDIYGALRAFDEYDSKFEVPLVTVRRKVRDSEFGPSDVMAKTAPPFTTKGRFEGIARREITGKLSYRVSNPASFQLWRYGITNPASIAWELLTLSFVLDWFTGLGNFIHGLQQPLGLSQLRYEETMYVRVRGRITIATWEGVSRYSTGMISVKQVDGPPRYGGYVNTVAFERNVYPSLPTPPITIRLVPKPDQLVNGLALALSFMGPKGTRKRIV